MVPASLRIASFAARFSERPLLAAQRHLAYRALLDTFAVAIAGQREDAARIAHNHLKDVTGIGKASAWATGESMPPEAAAWLNGTTAHLLDYDDMMPPLVGHPSVAMVPALVALAQATGADGKRFSSAYIAGYEVLAKIAKVMAMQHVIKGWHSTSSLGVLGAATGCSVLLGLDEAQTANALGLAVTQAAGNRENFGTMAKSFQVGQCGAAAVRSALLAQSGFTAPAGAIDGQYGYLALYGGKEDLTPALDSLGVSSLEFDAIGIDVKKYPCCYAVHKPLDGVLGLRAKHGLALDMVDSVEIVTQARGLQPLTYTDPKSGLEAKFSMEYSVAAALFDGNIRLASYDDDLIRRPAIQAFLPRVKKSESTGAMLPRWATVRIRLKNGGALEQHVTTSRGDAQDPLTDDELVAKAEDCFSYGGCEWSAPRFAAGVFGATALPLGDVLKQLTAQGGGRDAA